MSAAMPPAELVWPRHWWSAGECCYSDQPAAPGATRCPAGHVVAPVEVVPLIPSAARCAPAPEPVDVLGAVMEMAAGLRRGQEWTSVWRTAYNDAVADVGQLLGAALRLLVGGPVDDGDAEVLARAQHLAAVRREREAAGL